MISLVGAASGYVPNPNPMPRSDVRNRQDATDRSNDRFSADQTTNQPTDAQNPDTKRTDTTSPKKPGSSQRLTPDQQRMVTELQKRDLEVRNHEAAHQAVGGSSVGGASFTYQQGPDGRSYAIGGEVPVDASPVPNDPQATIAKMRQVQAAALAPGDPSSQDMAVASAAAQLMIAAQVEVAKKSASSNVGTPERDSANTINGPASATNHRAAAGYAQAQSTAVADPLGMQVAASA